MDLNKVMVVRYVNPHLFWIRELEDSSNLEIIEKRLRTEKATVISAEPNELVALQDADGFKRAIVTDVNNGYNCWLLDYGQPIFTCRVYYLPEELSAMLPAIKAASLDNIVGVSHRLNIETCIDEQRPYFDARTIQYIRNKLQQAKNVYFFKERKIGDVLCGSFILEINSATVNLAHLLIEKGHATVNKKLFLEALAEHSPKIPIIAFHEENVCDSGNICLLQGVGRGSHRTKGMCNMEKINAWLEKVSETSPISEAEDDARERDTLLDVSDISENDFSTASPIITSDSTVSVNISSSESPGRFDSSLDAKKLRGRGKLLNNEHNTFVNKKSVAIAKQETSTNANIVKKQSQTVQESKNWETSSFKNDDSATSKNHMKTKEILKALSFCREKLEQSASQATTDIDSVSFTSNKNKYVSKQINFSEGSSDMSGFVSDSQSVKRENCGNTLKGVIMKNSLECKCENCKKVFDDDFDETPKTFSNEVKAKDQFYKGKPQPILKNDTSNSGTIMVKKCSKNLTKIEKDIAPNLLIHSPGHLPTPTPEICNAPYCIPIHNALKALRYKTPRSMQMYMWPILMRSMNACIVNGHLSGKTMCYLPALCSFLLQKEERYPFLPKEPSPIALILCNSIKKAEEVFDLLNVFLNYTYKKVNIALLVPPIENLLLRHSQRAEIIVSTPKMFVRILTSRTINLKRLCHLVIEDIDKILDQTANELYKIIRAAQSMLDHRVFINSIQIILVSEKWTIALEDFIRRLHVAPVICIGSYLDSVIYAKANIEMHFVKKDEKRKRIITMLKENCKDLKTVIICNVDDEVLDLADYFQVLGISVIAVTQSMMREEIEEKEILWLSTPLKNNSVFICTDYMLHTQLSITTARMLIHYTLPSDSWSLFTRRFKCVIDSHDSPFNSGFNRAAAVKVHVFVDENCSTQFPRLCYFLQQMKTTLPQHFKSFCEKLENDEESVKIENKETICESLKLLGKCTKFRCKKRHLFSQSIDVREDMPSSGIIKFQLLHVADVAQFGIKVLKHWDTNREERNFNNYMNLVTTELQKCIKASRRMVTDVEVGSMYVYFDAKEVSYHRCKVLKILTRQQITDAAHEVKIKLIDDGIDKKAFASLLFELSPEFLEIPPQSIEARLANIVPLEHDAVWNLRTKCKVEQIINDLIARHPQAYFVGKIVLQVGETVWLEDLVMREDVVSSKETVTLLTLKKKLTKLDLVDFDESPLNNLREICMKSGLELPNYDINSLPEPNVKKIVQADPQWAHLNVKADIYNVVYFSHAESPKKFYVKLEKYYDLYMDLEEEIQNSVQKPFYPMIEEIVVGNCYLAKDPGGERYNRVVVKEIKEEIAKCFFADFGDTVDILLDDLQYLSDEHISKLPFQAIECELYGIKSITESWPPEATNIFYKFCYMTDTDIYRDLFVNVINSNPHDCGHKKYSVALLDYFENKTTVINRILIDCGLAIDDEIARLEDLILPEIACDDCNANSDDEEKKVVVQSDINVEELVECLSSKCDLPQNMEAILEDVDRNLFENGGLDFICSDFKTFMAELLMNKSSTENKQLTTASKNEFVPMKAMPSTRYYTPNIIWHQTKTHVIMEIQLPNVQDYSAMILKKKVFLFNTKLNDKDYMLNFPLFGNVGHMEKLNTGLKIKVTLTKANEEEWPKLANSKEKMRNIRYDLTKIEDDVSETRRFLDHGFGDDEDEDYPVIHNISSEEDTDSESEGFDDAT